MSKINEYYLALKQEEQEMKEREYELTRKEYLKTLDRALTNDEVAELFGSFNAYVYALARYTHDQHALAMKIKHNRKKNDWVRHTSIETEEAIARQEDEYLSRLAENFGRMRW